MSDWREQAACLEEDPELFFPIGTTGPAMLQIYDAKQVCRRCEVVTACLQFALEYSGLEGVWGGTSEYERASIRRKTARERAKDRTT